MQVRTITLLFLKWKFKIYRARLLGKKKKKLWDVKSHWKLVEEAYTMVDEEVDHETSREDNDCEESKNMENWEDELSVMVLNGN